MHRCIVCDKTTHKDNPKLDGWWYIAKDGGYICDGCNQDYHRSLQEGRTEAVAPFGYHTTTHPQETSVRSNLGLLDPFFNPPEGQDTLSEEDLDEIIAFYGVEDS